MANQSVTDYQDFTSTVLNNINQFDFNTPVNDDSSVAYILSSQLNGVQIFSNVTLNGSDGSAGLSITMDTASLDLSQLQFSNWNEGDPNEGDFVSVTGTAGIDTITGSSHYNLINSGGGDDIIIGNQGDSINAGDDDDTVTLNGVPVAGTLINGYATGGNGIDLLIVNAGAATHNLNFAMPSNGYLGFEQIQVTSGSGRDTLSGGSLADTLNGGASNDVLNGAGGIDTLIGGSGRDDIFGGSNNDIIDGGSGGDEIDGGSGNDTIVGGTGSDAIEGGTGIDDIMGGVGYDIIEGDSNNDTLDGGANADMIDGGTGNDFITGGLGRDTLSGGGGIDTFIFNAITEVGDTIEDFSSNDIIQLNGTAAGFSTLAGLLDPTMFISNASGHLAATATQHFIYDREDDSLWFDSNGSTAGGTVVKILDFATNENLTAADIVIV